MSNQLSNHQDEDLPEKESKKAKSKRVHWQSTTFVHRFCIYLMFFFFLCIYAGLSFPADDAAWAMWTMLFLILLFIYDAISTYCKLP